MKRVFSDLKQAILIFSIFFTAIFPSFSKDDTNKLKVGFLTDMPYMMEKNPETGYMSGYGYDYLQMIANYTGWEYEYIYGEWYYLWNLLINGEIDILEDVSYAPDRESKMLFPQASMGHEIYRLYVQKKNSDITTEKLNQTLQNKKVGITAGTIQINIFNEWLKKRKINCEVIPYISDFERNERLADGTLDAVVEMEASSLQEWEPIIEIGESEYYLALSNGNQKHLEELNSALTKISEIDPNFNNSLFYNYYSRTIVSSRLSNEEKNWLNEHKVLRCGYFNDLFSTSQINPGIYKDIIEEYLKALNITDLNVEYTYFPSYEALNRALQEDQIDIAYPFSEYTGASEIGNYSILTNVASFPVSMVTRKNKPVNSIQFIGIPDEGPGIYHAKTSFPNAVVVVFPNLINLLDNVANTHLDAAILPERLIKPNTLTHKRYENLEVIQLKYPYITTICTKRGNTALYQLLKRGNSLISSSFIKDIVAANTKYEVDYSFKTFVTNHVVFVILCMLFVFLMLALLHFVAYKRNVLEKNYISERSLRNELAQALKTTEEHQRKERELLYLSETDKLTGIANRGAEGKIRQFMEIGTLGMFCLFDVDKFKLINDNYGHLAGDKVLIAIADCMKRTFRETDIILRLGGDEFAAFTIGITDKEIATNLINRLFTEINRIKIPDLQDSEISISLGATFILSQNDIDFETVYKRADKGCYISKREQGNCFTFIDK